MVRCGKYFLEELDQSGEWCLDSEEGILSFWPPKDPFKEEKVVVPALEYLINVVGASYLTNSGFTNTETTGGDNLHHGDCDGVGGMFPMDNKKYCDDALHLNRSEYCRIENDTQVPPPHQLVILSFIQG